MIHRNPKNGQKLDVAGINEITVLVDRSETELTEVAMNSWTPAFDGPPHAHESKEQNFLVTEGRGTVTIGGQTFPAQPGAFFYVPANVIHQTITAPGGRLTYFLFNAFLDSTKEGHASFADHINKVKDTRKRQAETQNANLQGSNAAGKHVDVRSLSGGATTILARSETQRCEAIGLRLKAGERRVLAADAEKEQTFYVTNGSARFVSGAQTADVTAGETIFIPRGETLTIEAGPSGIEAVSFGTVVSTKGR